MIAVKMNENNHWKPNNCYEHIENIPRTNEPLSLFKLTCFANCKIILNELKFSVLVSDLMHTLLDRNNENGLCFQRIPF